MKIPVLFLCLFIACNDSHPGENKTASLLETVSPDAHHVTGWKRVQPYAETAKQWCSAHHYNNRFFFLADLSLPSGTKRFFIIDIKADSIVQSALVAHGCCNRSFLQTARFSNEKGCGCSSFGKYKIGSKYKGNYGTAYKLQGLDSSNSNAGERNIVLHSYYTVPNEETYPDPIVNSYGCPMVSERFFGFLEKKIDSSEKPILLWIVR